jgi:CarD family transcriptional regulator
MVSGREVGVKERRAKRRAKSNGSMTFETGDWIVHPLHGVGQIKAMETMRVQGRKRRCFRIENSQSTFWVPLEKQLVGRMRRTATISQWQRAMKVLRRSPKEMDPDHIARKRLLRNARSDSSILATVRALRDLGGRRAEKGLNDSEVIAMRQLSDRLLQEWVVCRQVSLEDAQRELDEILREIASEAA